MFYLNKSASGKRAKTPKWWPAVPQLFESAAEDWQYPSFLGGWLKRVPTSCPFERQLWWNNTLVFYMPKLCTIHPFYSAIMILVYRELNKDGR